MDHRIIQQSEKIQFKIFMISTFFRITLTITIIQFIYNQEQIVRIIFQIIAREL